MTLYRFGDIPDTPGMGHNGYQVTGSECNGSLSFHGDFTGAAEDETCFSIFDVAFHATHGFGDHWPVIDNLI